MLIGSDWRHDTANGKFVSATFCHDCSARSAAGASSGRVSSFVVLFPDPGATCFLSALCVHFNFSLHLPRSLPFPPCFFLHLLLAHLYQSLPNMCCTSRRIHTIMPLGAFAQRLFTQMEVDCHNGKAITLFAIPHLNLHISTIFCATGTREEGSGL